MARDGMPSDRRRQRAIFTILLELRGTEPASRAVGQAAPQREHRLVGPDRAELAEVAAERSDPAALVFGRAAAAANRGLHQSRPAGGKAASAGARFRA